MRKLVVGRAAFVDDVVPDGLLHAAVVPSAHDHARVLSLDTAAARTATGVVAVLGHDEGAPEPGSPDDRGRRALLTGVASYRGAAIALVAAEDPEVALRTAELVRATYEQLPVVSWPAGSAEAASLVLETGERGALDGKADLVIEARRGGGRTNASPPEPRVALTWLDEDGVLVVRSSTASPLKLRRVLADMLGVSGGRIRIERPEVGGDFGAREGSFLEVACSVLTLRTGRPVRMALGADEPAGRWDRPAWRATARGSLRGGELVAIDLALTQECGAEPRPADLEAELRRAASVRDLYRFPAFRFSGRVILTHAPPASGAAPLGATLALEGLMDAAAGALGEDPLSFRKRHLGGAPGLRPAFVALERALPDTVMGEPTPAGRSDAPASRAWGTALCRLPLPSARAQAVLACNEDGSYTLSWSPCEYGTAVAGGLEELVAKKLGVPVEQVATAHGSAADAPAEAVADPWLTAKAVGLCADEMGRKQRRAAKLRAGLMTRGEASGEDAPVPLGAFLALVSLDAETGLLTVDRLVQALAVGPGDASVLARAEGDALRGAGIALFETAATGARAARTGDVPAPETVMTPVGKRAGATGLPLGDVAVPGAAAAIVSAVARLLGGRAAEIVLPLLPERVFAARREHGLPR